MRHISLSWSAGSWSAALLLALPVLALFYEALLPAEGIFRHLWQSVLVDYTLTTFQLVLSVGLLVLLLALPPAWILAMCHLPGRRILQWSMMLPLAMPSYLVAYVYTELLDYSGPVQRTLRSIFGWQSASDYGFVEIRSLGGAALVLALVLFPYLYLLARTSFLEQSVHLIQSSRLLGLGPWKSFWRVSLPLSRPAIAVALSLVAMETLADFATVHLFAVNTLTTAVYDTWLGYGSLGAASKIAVMMMVVIVMLVSLERISRRRQRVYQKSLEQEQDYLYLLKGWRKWLALGYCWSLVGAGFLLPFGYLCQLAWRYFEQSWTEAFWRFGLNSLKVSLLAAMVTLGIACMLCLYRRLEDRPVAQLPARLGSLGYAMPGTVLAIGVLAPLSALDFAINDLADWLHWERPGLLLSGTLIAIVFAYAVRFAAIAIGAVESSVNKVSPSLDMVARTLGCAPAMMVRRVHLPLIRKGILAGFLLVFIESMKELPAALLLRPFNFETLATYVYQFVSTERLEQGALAAIVIVLVGLIPIIYLNRSLEQHQ